MKKYKEMSIDVTHEIGIRRAFLSVSVTKLLLILIKLIALVVSGFVQYQNERRAHQHRKQILNILLKKQQNNKSFSFVVRALN